MKGKILYDAYREREGTSFVRKATKYGEFTASVKACDSDMDIANRWDGCRFAEYLCDMQALEVKVKLLRERYIGVLNSFKNAEASMKKYEQWNAAKYIIELWKRQINHAKHQWKEAQALYDLMAVNYDTFCENVIKERRETRNKIEKLHEGASE